MSNSNECDFSVIAAAVLVFTLPLTLLVPGFSVWDVVPKVRIERCPIISQDVTWNQLNASTILLLCTFLTIYLEIRKRRLDDMVEKVLAMNRATDDVVGIEQERQGVAIRSSINLVDASTEHYELLMLYRDELRKREKVKHQSPPIIELSSETVAN